MAKTVFDGAMAGKDFVTLQVNSEELKAVTTFLKFAKDCYIHMASEAIKDKNTKSFDVYNHNAKVAETLFAKFASLAQIGEPDHSQIH